MAATQRTKAPRFGYEFEPATIHIASEQELDEPKDKPFFGAAQSAGFGLIDDHGAAAFFGVGIRTFQSFMTASWMPKPITLGPRLRRWAIQELSASVARMPREAERASMPTPLRAHIDTLKGRLPAAEARDAQ